MLRLKTSATSHTNGEWEKAGDSRASRGEGKVLRVRIYTPAVLKVIAFPGKRGGQLPPLPLPGYAPAVATAVCALSREAAFTREVCRAVQWLWMWGCSQAWLANTHAATVLSYELLCKLKPKFFLFQLF